MNKSVSPQTFVSTARPAKNEMAELYEPMIAGLTRYSGAVCDGYTAISSEWLSFLNKRLHTDLSLAARLTHCGSPQDYVQEWSTFMTTAAADYRQEFEKIAQISTAASQKMVTSMHVNGR